MRKNNELTYAGAHKQYSNIRRGRRGGVLTSLGFSLFGADVNAEFNREDSESLAQKARTTRIRWSESDDVKRARKLSKEGLHAIAALLDKVQIAQYTEAADIKGCREAWEDSVEASYKDEDERQRIDQQVFRSLICVVRSSTVRAGNANTSKPIVSTDQAALEDRLTEELMELVDNRREKKGFWEELLKVPVGHDEGGVRRTTLNTLGVRDLTNIIPTATKLSYVDTTGCYYTSREAWDGTDATLFSEEDWNGELQEAAKSVRLQMGNYIQSNGTTRTYVNSLLDPVPTAVRNIVVDVVSSVTAKRFESGGKSAWKQGWSDQIRQEVRISLLTKGMKEWQAPSRAIASICLLIVTVEHGSIRFEDAKMLLHEVCRRIFVCYIRETARDLVRKSDAMRQSGDLPTQAEALSARVGNELNRPTAQLQETAAELRAAGYNLPRLLERTKDRLTKMGGGQEVLYTNIDYGASFILKDIETLEEARYLAAAWLIEKRIGLTAYIDACHEEAQRRQKCEAPEVDATYDYSETRAARSVMTESGKVSKVSHAHNVGHMRTAFLKALDADDKMGYRAMVLQGGGIFVIEYKGSGRKAWVNVGSGVPWLITGGGQRSEKLGAKTCAATLVWRDYVVEALVETQTEVRVSSMLEQIGSDSAKELYPNLGFEVAASLLGRGWLLVTVPEVQACAVRAINVVRREESYADYLSAKNEKAANGSRLRSLIADSAIGMELQAMEVNNKLVCGKSLEFEITGYWPGDKNSLCHLEKNEESEKWQRLRTFGKPEVVRAVFDGR